MAAAAILRRRECQNSLVRFTEDTYEKYRTAPHHRLIAEQLERVARGDVDRLMLQVPPRHGKSELASIRFPAWFLGRNPDRQIVSVSATAELATDFGRAVRNLISSPEYRVIFDTTLAEDSQARGKWHTSRGGVYYAIGVDGTIMGRGADILLIDDPFATMADAQSEVMRKRVRDAYTGTLYNRLMPGGRVVIIAHRMHEDDLTGFLLQQQAAGGDRWEVVSLPAIDDQGRALWDESYPIEALERIRANTPPRYWSALFLQNPVAEDGDYFRAAWFKPVVQLPDHTTLSVYGGSDYAVTTDGGDYTVHVVIGVDPEGRVYLLDLWRKQAPSDEWIESLCDLVLKWKPIGWAEEQGQIKAGIGPFLDRRSREREAWVARTQFPTRGDKSVRASSIRGHAALSGIYYQATAPWWPELRSELMAFPAGRHDDQVDALGLVGQLLDKMAVGPKPPEAEPPKYPTGYVPVREEPESNDWIAF